MASPLIPLLAAGTVLYVLSGKRRAKKSAAAPIAPGVEPIAPGAEPTPPQFGEDELLVADPECDYIIHHDDRWFEEQKRRTLAYAMDGAFDVESAGEIHRSMLSDYIPLCLTLGRNGVGPGVRDFWDKNLAHVVADLQRYEILPETIDEDAAKFGLL